MPRLRRTQEEIELGVTKNPASRSLRVGLAQIAPRLLDRIATLDKVVARVDEAASKDCGLVAFGEALVPGYPVWLARSDGARFDAADQKRIHARYHDEAVVLERGDLDPICDAARRGGLDVVLGVIERPKDRGHSLYCSLVWIDARGRIVSAHRKLVPTYEERLAWSIGDGHGLRVHEVGAFTAGGLNCWENWLPLARAALHGQGEDLHVAIWPGSLRNTEDITRFAAREGRSYCVSVAAPLRGRDVADDAPERARWIDDEDEWIHDGGSCVAGPDGQWVLEPVTHQEGLFVADLDPQRVAEERQNMDPSGHYCRPDVLQLFVQRERQRSVVVDDSSPHDEDEQA